jgi:hypothetical protein
LPFGTNDDLGLVGDDLSGMLDAPSDFFEGDSPFTGDGDGAGGDQPSSSNELTGHENPPGSGDDDAPNPSITTLTNLVAPTPVPEPATLWLTATGLAAASRFRRKIKP